MTADGDPGATRRALDERQRHQDQDPQESHERAHVARAQEEARQDQRDHEDVDRDVLGEGDVPTAHRIENATRAISGPLGGAPGSSRDFQAAEMRPGTRAGTTDRDFGAPLMVVIPSGRWRSLYGARPEARLTMRTPEEIPADQHLGAHARPAHEARPGPRGGRRRPRRRGRRRAAGRPIASGVCSGRTVSIVPGLAPPRPSARRGRPTSRATARRAGCGPGRSGCMRCRNSTSAR